MKIDCVLTAVNEDPIYIDFIPIFIKSWNKLYPELDVKIVLIANCIPERFELYKDNIILFKPIKDVLTGFTAQFIRLLYPCILNYKNGVIITDMDMMPINRRYFTEHIKVYDNDKFIYYRGFEVDKNSELSMCYNVATPEIWRDIFKINSVDDIVNRIKEVKSTTHIVKGHGRAGWSTDQKTLYRKVMEWNKITNNLVRLIDNKTGFVRLNRIFTFSNGKIQNDNIINGIKSGYYKDYHMFRPMNKYSELNWEVYNLL